jgi:regulator of RNase E activity RraA
MSTSDANPGDVPPVSAIADVLALWDLDGWLTPPLSPLVAPPSPVMGRARTLQIEAGTTGGGLGDVYDLLSRDLDGCIVVVAGAYSVGGAMWGEILSTAATGRHAVGALVDGSARDHLATQQIGLPLYARELGVVGPAGRAHVVAVDDAVSIHGVDVIADDTLVLDASGCVRVPQMLVDQVLDAATRYAAAEDEVVRMLAAGRPLTRAYLAKKAVVNELAKERLAGIGKGW